MQYRCLNNVGYEDRLTVGKVYVVNLRREDFLVVVLDDDTQSEVFEDRFEEIGPEFRTEYQGEFLSDAPVANDALQQYGESQRKLRALRDHIRVTAEVHGLSKDNDDVRKALIRAGEQAEEGDPCECGGRYAYLPVEGCTCHTGHPPCSACVKDKPRCNQCHLTCEEVVEECST